MQGMPSFPSRNLWYEGPPPKAPEKSSSAPRLLHKGDTPPLVHVGQPEPCREYRRGPAAQSDHLVIQQTLKTNM